PQAVPFRTKVNYSNLMYGVLGEVIEAKSGLTWDQFVQQRLLQPLEMNSTFVTRDRVSPDRLARRHRRYDGVVLPVRNAFPEHVVSPSGAIHSSVVDMAQWLKLQLHDGEHGKQRLLQADTVRDMHALVQSIPVRRQPGANVYRAQLVGTGLGWFVS